MEYTLSLRVLFFAQLEEKTRKIKSVIIWLCYEIIMNNT